MLLEFDQILGKLHLVIKHYKYLANFDERKDERIKCFSISEKQSVTNVSITNLFVKKHLNKVTEVDNNVYELKIVADGADYWCEGYTLENFEKISSGTLWVQKIPQDNTYSALFEVNYDGDLKSKIILSSFDKMATHKPISDHLAIKQFKFVKIMKNYKTSTILAHLLFENVSANVIVKQLNDFINITVSFRTVNLTMISYNNTNYCAHQDPNADNNSNMTWPQTTVGQITTSVELCLDAKGIPLFRKCEGNYTLGGKWQKISADGGKCKKPSSEVTNNIINILNQCKENVTKKLVSDMQIETSNFKAMTSADICFFSQFSQKIAENVSSDIEINYAFASSINNLMSVDNSQAKESQTNTNSTDRTLDSIENYFNQLPNNYSKTTEKNNNKDFNISGGYL